LLVLSFVNIMAPKKTKNVMVGTRISPTTYRMMQDAIARDLHVTEAEFTRDAIIEYVKNNWPDIYAKHSGRKIEESSGVKK